MQSQSAVTKILKTVRGHGRGYVFTPTDFVDMAGRAAVDQALARLTKQGLIRRVRRGLYDYPRLSPRLGVLAPSTDQVSAAIARVTGVAVRPSSAQLANSLGLSTQVPARTVLETAGPSKRLKVGKQHMTVRHRSPRVIGVRATRADDVIRALRYLGPAGVTEDVVSRLAVALKPEDKRALRRAKRRAPTWLHSVIDAIAPAPQ